MINIMPTRIAQIVYNDLMGCMSDLANGDEGQADENWNDPDVLGDMLGDRINDHLVPFNLTANTLRREKNKVAFALIGIGHPAMTKAAHKIIK